MIRYLSILSWIWKKISLIFFRLSILLHLLPGCFLSCEQGTWSYSNINQPFKQGGAFQVIITTYLICYYCVSDFSKISLNLYIQWSWVNIEKKGISSAILAGRCLVSQWYSLLFNIHLFSIFTYTWFGTKSPKVLNDKLPQFKIGTT